MTLQNDHGNRPLHSHPVPTERPPVQDAAEFIKRKVVDEERDLSDLIIRGLLLPFSMIAPLLFLVGLIGCFLWKAFEANLNVGIRSFAAVMIPLVVLAAAYWAHYMAEKAKTDEEDNPVGRVVMRKLDEVLEDVGVFSSIPPWVTFSVLALIAAGSLAIIRAFHSTTIPVPEFVLSATFSLLLYCHMLPSANKMSYYFGAVIGFLVYIVLFGMPVSLAIHFPHT